MSGAAAEIRLLGAEDAAAYRTLRLRALRDCPTAFASSYEEERERPLARVAERVAPAPGHAVFGAFGAAGLVGMVGLHREEYLKLRHKAFVWGMYVEPASRRRGVGRALVERALAHAAAMPGLRQVTLGVNAENAAAVALYEALGFERIGVEPGFLCVDGVLYDEIRMVLVLDGRA